MRNRHESINFGRAHYQVAVVVARAAMEVMASLAATGAAAGMGSELAGTAALVRGAESLAD